MVRFERLWETEMAAASTFEKKKLEAKGIPCRHQKILNSTRWLDLLSITWYFDACNV